MKTKFMIGLDLHDCRALLASLHTGKVENQITDHQYQALKNPILDVMANLEARGNCPECMGNGQLQGDYGQDWNCETCEANDIDLFIDRRTYARG